MKSTDVRINNWVFDELETKVRQIEPLDFFSDTFKYLTPIPLDEQWLLKLGFTKYTWCDDCAFIPFLFGKSLYCRFYNDKWHIQTVKIREDKEGYFCDSQPKNIVPKGFIKHVHQLQNLTHSLTGKELTLNK